ncbi:2-oxoacid:ferredoxin oxidoreductase subunit gamma [Endomicrobiia bacterium]|nr:2-oxoacid:ferredoxin oxidoreductase subunit gamma [Endomicrobiia bacterium]
MQIEVVIAGFGGQGVLLAGTLMAQAAIEQGLYTTWFPSYGAEMRGGTANSTVIVSSDEIGSPFASNPNVLVALNEPSLDKFMPVMIDEAVIIANSSVISQDRRYKIKPYFVPAADIASKEIKNIRTANMVSIGALIKALEIRHINAERQTNNKKNLTLKNALSACEKAFALKSQLIEVNKKAIRAGYNFIK